MPRRLVLPLAALALVFSSMAAFAQSFQPKSIRFTGAPDYSDQEMVTTLGLTPGAVLTYDQMNRAAQKLVDTGMFSSVSFKFDGQDLIFQLAPASGLVPLHLQNLPLHAGKELDDRLHHQFPLYHGELPEQGGLTESVRVALEQMLAAQGIKASVVATTGKDPQHKPSSVGFAIASPAVLVGDLRTEGAVVALDPRASAIVTKFSGTPYDVEGSPAAIEADFTAYYKDQGYPDPAVHVTPIGKAVVSANGIRIPMRVSIVPGVQYKLAAVTLAPNLLVSQADFDRQFHFRPGEVADGERLRTAWKFIAQPYRERGYIKAQVQPAVTIDHSKNTVNYDVTVEPGPQYTMGKLTIDNVTDDLRSQMMAAWKMPAGSLFNESVISGFFSTHGVNPSLEQALSGADYRYVVLPNDATRTVDVKLSLEKKP